MGWKTFFVEVLRGEQAPEPGEAARPPGLHGRAVDAPPMASSELLRALADAAQMHRDSLAGLSAGGKLTYKLRSIVAYLSPAHEVMIPLARQPMQVRLANARQVLAPVFGAGGFVDISELASWHIRKKGKAPAPPDDGFEDARILQPESAVEVGFAFDGEFVAQGATASTPATGTPSARPAAKGSGARLVYRVVGSDGAEQLAGTIVEFPATVGRDYADVNLPERFTRVSGPHVAFSLNAAGEVCAADVGASGVGSTNGTWLVRSGKTERIRGATVMTRDGRLMLGSDTAHAKAATLEFRIDNGRGRQGVPARGARRPTSPAEEVAKPPARSRAGVTKIAGGRAKPTRIAGGTTAGKYGVLVLRYSSGDEETVPIDRLPFTIGREPRPDGGQVAVVRPVCERVSRSHLRIEGAGRNGVFARNMTRGRNGCYLGARMESDGFFWSFSAPGDGRQEWLGLGGDQLDTETVWSRIYPARAA